jgi:hypothetical protein
MEQHATNTGATRVQHASKTPVAGLESRGSGPTLRVNQVKQTSNHGNDHDAKYQP